MGRPLRELRETKGLSRRALAQAVGVDPTAVAAWERGLYAPRAHHRRALADALGTTVGHLFHDVEQPLQEPMRAALTQTMEDFPKVLVECLAKTTSSLRALRLAAPYSTPAYVQEAFRLAVSARILDGSLAVERAEIIYDLARLKELVSNIIRYDGRAYSVKSYCAGLREVAPAMGGYFFDDREFLVGAYWTGVPPRHKPGIRLSGEPFKTYFHNYWDEIWRRGTLLNIRGAKDLTAAREVAMTLGLPPADWPMFVEEAGTLEIGDGAPPLV